MAQSSILSLPVTPTAASAWANYAKLAKVVRDNPTSLTLCAVTARAYRDWQRLYLAGDV